MFFRSSSFRFLPPLKNDGRGDVFFNGIKYRPVILERSEESRQRIQALNTFCDYPLPDSWLRVILYSFLLSSFRFLPPLKNDGRGEFCFSMVLHSCLSFLNEVKNPGREYRY